MANSYEYKPPLGFDIRVKPDAEKSVEEEVRLCDWPGCEAEGTCRVRASPDRLSDFRWYCEVHAREHNQAWDFFRGKSDAEIAAYQASNAFGHRPTWSMGVNGWTRDEKAAEARRRSFRPGQDTPGRTGPAGTGGAEDPFDLFRGAFRTPGPEGDPVRRPVSRLQRAALDDLGLDETADLDAVKTRYKELVKRFHPDANGGDRGAEESLSRVIRAYQTLKASGFR